MFAYECDLVDINNAIISSDSNELTETEHTGKNSVVHEEDESNARTKYTCNWSEWWVRLAKVKDG